MTINALNAANAYRNQLKMMDDAPPAMDEGTPQSSFSQMLTSAVQGFSDAGEHSEQLQMQSLTGSGKVELSDLVTAVANAELTLNTVVAVRDKVINAYNDIIKMSI
jgi:flagellar hook-basal body complex protein FliE